MELDLTPLPSTSMAPLRSKQPKISVSKALSGTRLISPLLCCSLFLEVEPHQVWEIPRRRGVETHE